MRRSALASLAAVVLATASCGGQANVAEAPTSARSSAGNGDLPRGDEPVTLDPTTFTTRIDNRWWPMAPGTRWRYRETDQEGAGREIVVTVTNQTKTLANGVTARVVRDTVSEDGTITEDTFDFYAQDKHGNIWYLGEDTAEFENGKLTTKAGSFEAGVDGAMAGVIMPAHPRDGQAYRQEYYKGEAEDRGEVLSTHELAETPYGRFKRALLTKDTTPLEPNVLEYKLYAPRIGPVLALGVSGGPGSREELLKFGKAPARWVEKASTMPLGQGPT
jgi:hypothetical protein